MSCSHDLIFTGKDRGIRAVIYLRDGYSCRQCGVQARSVPDDYDGSYALQSEGLSKAGYPTLLCIDHIVSRRRGGSNKPNNLQTLCESCNSRKSVQDNMQERAA